MRDYSGPVRWFYTHVNVGSTIAFLDEGQDNAGENRGRIGD